MFAFIFETHFDDWRGPWVRFARSDSEGCKIIDLDYHLGLRIAPKYAAKHGIEDFMFNKAFIVQS